MPSQPAWFHRLEKILEEINGMSVTHLDRLAIERLFFVGERRARQLMLGLPGMQVGNAFAVDRLALLDHLKNLQTGKPFELEISRRVRVAEHLEDARKQIAARRVAIPVTEIQNKTVECLGDGITLSRGELKVQFKTAEELAGKLFQLAQAMANDWGAFLAKVDVSSGG